MTARRSTTNPLALERKRRAAWWVGKPAEVIQAVQVLSERSRVLIHGTGRNGDLSQITALIQYLTR